MHDQLFLDIAKAVRTLHNTQYLNEHFDGSMELAAEYLAPKFRTPITPQELLDLCKILIDDPNLQRFSANVDRYRAQAAR